MLWEAPPMIPPKGILWIFFFIFSFDSAWLEERLNLFIFATVDYWVKEIDGVWVT